MAFAFTKDMRAIVRAAHLCFAATVSPEGRPNVSPKGTIRVWDEHSLFFLDIASPQTRANLAANPWIELNVVDQLSRRGYRFSGPAAVHTQGRIFEQAIAAVSAEEKVAYDVAAVVVIELDRASPLFSPAYWHLADEREIRSLWTERRQTLDREFEAYVDAEGPARVTK
jgi:predicted pyridoxine 5'-phosphate oxidase superfamily flavin-nucleotide-binding protein